MHGVEGGVGSRGLQTMTALSRSLVRVEHCDPSAKVTFPRAIQPVVVPEFHTWVELNIHLPCSTREGYLGQAFQAYKYPVDCSVHQLTVHRAEVSDLLIRDIQRDVYKGDLR